MESRIIVEKRTTYGTEVCYLVDTITHEECRIFESSEAFKYVVEMPHSVNRMEYVMRWDSNIRFWMKLK